MELSNSELVGRGLQLLRYDLKPFIVSQMHAIYGGKYIDEALSALRNDQNRVSAGTDPNLWDVHVMLSIMLGRWEVVFARKLSRDHRTLVHELIEVRNNSAHQQEFTDEDTYRALDSIGRLLKAISTEPTAKWAEVEKLRQQALRTLVGGEPPIVEEPRTMPPITPLSGKLHRASDLLKPDESAIVLFTKGLRLVIINPDGSGSSGNWVTKPNHHDRPDKVIVYNRIPDRIPIQSDIYLAKYVGAVSSHEPDRLVIQFQGASLVGTTNQNWHKFAETGSSPVRYLARHS